jgi:hypothetical protein
VSAARALAAWLVPFAAGLPVLGQDAATAEDAARARAFIEVETPRASAWLGETVRVRVRFGIEREFLENGVLQLFQRPLDVPVQVQASWLAGGSCAVLLIAEDGPGSAAFALGDGIARARRMPEVLRDGVPYAEFEFERNFVLTCPGDWTLEGPTLRFAYATSFRVDAFGERTPADRLDGTLTGSGLRLPVLPLPEEGRPTGFSGAVGSFSVSAQAEPRELAVGDSLKLEIVLSGEGDLSRCTVPLIERVEGLRPQGWVDSMRDGARVITYDLVALAAGPTAVPSIEFSYFDPTPPGSYRTVGAEPIPLNVSTRMAAAQETERSAPAEPERRSLVRMAAYAVLLGGLLGGLLGAVRGWQRRRDHDLTASQAAEANAHATAQEVLALAEKPDAELGHAFAEYLARRLECQVPAVIGPGLSARLVAAGIPSHKAAAAAALLDELVASRYGGGPLADAAQRARALVEELEIEFCRSPKRS